MRNVLAISLAFVSAVGVFAQQHPNLDRGFDPNKVYQFDGVESVDL
ncbi:MAG: hypothetical protein KatS3mg007_2207 [Thermoanaerobaculum sp.]|nr:MAG: hypothetical protein KatS3mg007_2207 [Thermoanaerobaculum sp.]